METISFQEVEYVLFDLTLAKGPSKTYVDATFTGLNGVGYTTLRLAEEVRAYENVMLRILDVDKDYMYSVFKLANELTADDSRLMHYVIRAPSYTDQIRRLRKFKLLTEHGNDTV